MTPKGNIAWDEASTALAATGFRGGLAMESFTNMPTEFAFGLSVWRPVWIYRRYSYLSPFWNVNGGMPRFLSVFREIFLFTIHEKACYLYKNIERTE